MFIFVTKNRSTVNSVSVTLLSRRLPLSILFLALLIFNAGCITSSDAIAETTDITNSEEVTDWFRDAKFGMFIHWGLYSQTGGIWNGDKYYGITEWLMRRGEIPSTEYKTIADQFNPTKFNAEQWVSIAQESGVKYIVITAKHHDGFALFDSAVSDFDIVDASPFKRDPLKELTTAAQAAGIKIGFYYSQYQDWTEPNAGGNNWEFDSPNKDLQSYLNSKALPQLEELLTNYGPIDIIWFDTPGSITLEQSKELKAWVKALQPNCLVTDRIGHKLGDYQGYRDGEIPAVVPQIDRPWEAIFTHNDSWGYSQFDNNFKSTSEVLELFLTIAGKGGNLMLNVGPDGRGSLPKDSVETFLEVGKWLKTNAESIYGTEGSPVGTPPWGHMTQRSGKLYLHVTHVPKNNKLIVPGLSKIDIDKVSTLATGKKLRWKKSDDDIYVSLPNKLPDSRASVIVIDHNNGLIAQSDPQTIVSSQYKETVLEAAKSTVNGESVLRKYSTMHYFGDWKHDWTVAGLNSVKNSAEWQIRVIEPGAYKIRFDYSASAKQALQQGVMSITDENFYFKVLETGEFANPRDATPRQFATKNGATRKPLMFFDHPIGVVHFPKPGIYTLSVRPDQLHGDEELFKLRSIIIESHD